MKRRTTIISYAVDKRRCLCIYRPAALGRSGCRGTRHAGLLTIIALFQLCTVKRTTIQHIIVSTAPFFEICRLSAGHPGVAVVVRLGGPLYAGRRGGSYTAPVSGCVPLLAAARAQYQGKEYKGDCALVCVAESLYLVGTADLSKKALSLATLVNPVKFLPIARWTATVGIDPSLIRQHCGNLRQ